MEMTRIANIAMGGWNENSVLCISWTIVFCNKSNQSVHVGRNILTIKQKMCRISKCPLKSNLNNLMLQ